MNSTLITILIILILIIFTLVIQSLFARFKQVPNDRTIAIYNRKKEIIKIIQPNNSVFVWPYFHDYEFLDLTPISHQYDLKIHIDEEFIDVKAKIHTSIKLDNDGLFIAAKKYISLSQDEIHDLVHEEIGNFLYEHLHTHYKSQYQDTEKIINHLNRELKPIVFEVYGLQIIPNNKSDHFPVLNYKHPTRC